MIVNLLVLVQITCFNYNENSKEGDPQKKNTIMKIKVNKSKCMHTTGLQ